jgi:hypothetical protein
LAEEALMSSDGLEGLTVRVRDGQALGVVVGVFADGPLAGRLRVQGDNIPRSLPSRTAAR